MYPFLQIRASLTLHQRNIFSSADRNHYKKPQPVKMQRTTEWSTQSTDSSTTQSLTQDQEDIAEEEAKKNVRAGGPVWDISCQTVFYVWQGKYTQEIETASLPIRGLKLIALIDLIM